MAGVKGVGGREPEFSDSFQRWFDQKGVEGVKGVKGVKGVEDETLSFLIRFNAGSTKKEWRA